MDIGALSNNAKPTWITITLQNIQLYQNDID